jgi:hypothetical protein
MLHLHWYWYLLGAIAVATLLIVYSACVAAGKADERDGTKDL